MKLAYYPPKQCVFIFHFIFCFHGGKFLGSPKVTVFHCYMRFLWAIWLDSGRPNFLEFPSSVRLSTSVASAVLWKARASYLDSILKSRDITLTIKVCLVKAMVFPVVRYSCEESWGPKNWCFWTVLWEKILESPLDSKEIQPVNPKENQSWIFIGRTDAEAEAPILGHLVRKDPDGGKDWRQKEKGTTEYEMVGWHHRLNGHKCTKWTWVWPHSRS